MEDDQHSQAAVPLVGRLPGSRRRSRRLGHRLERHRAPSSALALFFAVVLATSTEASNRGDLLARGALVRAPVGVRGPPKSPSSSSSTGIKEKRCRQEKSANGKKLRAPRRMDRQHWPSSERSEGILLLATCPPSPPMQAVARPAREASRSASRSAARAGERAIL
jgi:hypothetical protein